MNANHLVPLQHSYKFANKFYGPIILLSALNGACVHSRPVKSPDLSLGGEQSPERVFHDFVNKLALLCDIERGGKTVTALTVLQYPDQIQYRFTSNNRETGELDQARKFLTSTLNALGEAKKYNVQDITSNILRASLSFTRPRVEFYVKALQKQVSSCISASRAENTDESRLILRELEELEGKLVFFNNEGLKDNHFSQHCEKLIKHIDQLYKSEVEVLIHHRTRDGRMNKSECWSELRHLGGRLLSYLRAAKTLVSVSKLRPELFDNYEVCNIASNSPGRYIFKGKHSPEKMSADRIVGCMTSDPRKLEEYREHAQELQKFELDKLIQIKTSKQKFRPIVHAEVLLLDWLQRDGGTHPSRFFNGYKYIGCSKPTCRLCEYFFSVHASGVEVRPPHRNLYTNWRMPDVYEANAMKDTERLMDKILELVRKETFRVLVEKVPEGKRHDSNTDPTYLIGSISGGRTENMEQLEESLTSLDFDSSDHEASCSPTNPEPFDENEELTPESDDDDDDDAGGVKL